MKAPAGASARRMAGVLLSRAAAELQADAARLLTGERCSRLGAEARAALATFGMGSDPVALACVAVLSEAKS